MAFALIVRVAQRGPHDPRQSIAEPGSFASLVVLSLPGAKPKGRMVEGAVAFAPCAQVTSSRIWARRCAAAG